MEGRSALPLRADVDEPASQVGFGHKRASSLELTGSKEGFCQTYRSARQPFLRHREISTPPPTSSRAASVPVPRDRLQRIGRTGPRGARRLARGWSAPVSNPGKLSGVPESRRVVRPPAARQVQNRLRWLARLLDRNAAPSDGRRHRAASHVRATNMATAADRRFPNETYGRAP